MKELKNPSKKRQFVAIWVYEGEIYSGTYRYSDSGVLLELSFEGRWIEAAINVNELKERYFVA